MANDFDGSVASWTIVNDPSKGVLSGTAPTLTYTPNPDTIGTDSFTFTATDDFGAVSKEAVVTLSIRDCDMLSLFNVPRSTALPAYPTLPTTFTNVHVSEDGPALASAFEKHDVQWTGNDLHQFAINLSEAPYYLDLRTCMTQSFAQNSPSMTLTNCGLGLDGEYWINSLDGNEIWVEKNNLFSIIFSNDSSPPEFCNTGNSPRLSPLPTQPEPITPSPTISPTTVTPTPSPTSTSEPTTVTPTTSAPFPKPTTHT